MSLLKDIVSIVADLLSAGIKIERAMKLEVAQHFENLAKVFMAYPAAHRAKDRERLTYLIAKTEGLIVSLQDTRVFASVLGDDVEKRFVERIKDVLTQKALLAGNVDAESEYDVIVKAAAHLDGYAETLRAQAGKAE